MLPPPDLSISQNNPKLVVLHKRLGDLLDGDGAIRLSAKESARRKAIEEEYEEAQTDALETRLLRSALPRLYSSDLPEELRDLITLISNPLDASHHCRINHVLSVSSIDPLPLGPPLSEELVTLTSQLLCVADPLAKKPYTVKQVKARQEELKVREKKLHHARLDLAVAASRIQEIHRETYDTTIKSIEGVKHGSAARSAIAEAGYFATVAEGLDEKLKVMKLEVLQAIYDPEVRRALEAYDEHLNEVRVRLKGRQRAAEQKLREYEKVGKGMSDIAERYAWLSQELESVKSQVGTLESRS